MAFSSDIVSKLYRSIEASNEERVFEHWHASSIGDCPRAHYFKRMGVKGLNKPGAGKVLRWKAGHLIEEAIREHIETIFPELQSNERFTSESLGLTGEYDNLSGQTLIEIKSVHDGAFIRRDGVMVLKEKAGTKTQSTGRVVNQWKARDEPYLHHQMQNHSYAILLKEKKNIDIKKIIYVYISLGGLMCVYDTDINPEITKLVEKRLEVLNTALKTGVPPACLCGNENHPLYAGVMSYCDYKTDSGCCDLKLLEDVDFVQDAIMNGVVV